MRHNSASPSAVDIVVPVANWCSVGHVLRGGGNVLWLDQSCLRNGADLITKSIPLRRQALTPYKTSRGQLSITNKLDIQRREQGVTNLGHPKGR
jgi:hypothetical protein